MDILFQYLNIKKQKQEYIKVLDIPCILLRQAIESKMVDRAVSFIDYMQQAEKCLALSIIKRGKRFTQVSKS
jgi:hypothetical protein